MKKSLKYHLRDFVNLVFFMKYLGILEFLKIVFGILEFKLEFQRYIAKNSRIPKGILVEKTRIP
ncbi:MAG: hypothetical protein MR927_05760 [Campylobacter sp.]|nr:hypothetical protein [Campylobacter sp.]MCI7103680.1 hypothetical protein [Campylobacter sp.]